MALNPSGHSGQGTSPAPTKPATMNVVLVEDGGTMGRTLVRQLQGLENEGRRVQVLDWLDHDAALRWERWAEAEWPSLTPTSAIANGGTEPPRYLPAWRWPTYWRRSTRGNEWWPTRSWRASRRSTSRSVSPQQSSACMTCWDWCSISGHRSGMKHLPVR